MTTPKLALDSAFGRLYRRPSTDPQELPGVEDALASGSLMPSVTNVIGCLDKPFLTTWYGKLAAEDAVETVRKHPGLIESRPQAAVGWLKKAGHRRLTAAAALGDEVHQAAEALALGLAPDPLSDAAGPYVEGVRQFLSEFSPRFLHVEATCFGVVNDPLVGPLPYAGTADFIAEVNGMVLVGDFKTGKSIHTEAALQVAALANATDLALPDGTLVPMPRSDSGLIVHVRPGKFVCYQADTGPLAWQLFGTLRRLWDFHVANLESRGPLLMSGPLKSGSGISPAPLVRAGSRLASGVLQPTADIAP